MKAIITVIGKDKIGIIKEVSSELANSNVNILDISQTILDNYFTMIMLVDLSHSTLSFSELKDNLDTLSSNLMVKIIIQHEDIFNSMHKI